MSLCTSVGYASISSLLSISIEERLPPNNIIYQAKKVWIKTNHPLNDFFAKFLPECAEKKNRQGNSFTTSIEDPILDILQQQKNYKNLTRKKKISYEGISYRPDGIVIGRVNYLIEVKSMKNKNTKDIQHKHRFICLQKKAALQALRNSSALIMAGEVDSVIPKIAIGLYTPTDKEDKVKILGIFVYKVGWKNHFEIDKELAKEIFSILGK